MRRLLPLVLLLLAAAHPAAAEEDGLVEALRAGGHVLYFRHAATEWSQRDQDRQDLSSCDTQRNLSAAGRAQARLIGRAFQRLGIPVGAVLTSPYCRAYDTAFLAFGRAERTGDLLSRGSARDAQEREALALKLRALLSAPPPDRLNTVLSAHMWNMQDAAGLTLMEGEMAAFAPEAAQGFQLVGRLSSERLAALAGLEQAPAE